MERWELFQVVAQVLPGWKLERTERKEEKETAITPKSHFDDFRQPWEGFGREVGKQGDGRDRKQHSALCDGCEN